ncbi:MAG: hypothetical protein M3024_03950 [Candidatus Dormibacteraeota bacterium]|nr:hypothetical protein [Candidatus Dormibacteraeota bacterium]
MSPQAPDATPTASQEGQVAASPDTDSPWSLVPPHDLQAEAAVLGSFLLQPRMLDEIALILQPEDFYRSTHAETYRAGLALSSRAEPIDNVTLAAELEARGVLERVGGRSQLALLMDTTPTAANAAYYARLVKAAAGRRSLLQLGKELCRLSQEAGLEVAELIDRVSAQLEAIRPAASEPQLVAMPALLDDALARLRDRQATQDGLAGLPSGVAELDGFTGGWDPGELVVIAGRGASETSSFALQVARHAALEQRVAIVLFSLQTSRQTVADRLLCAAARVDHEQYRRGQVTADELGRLDQVAATLRDAPLAIDDRSWLDPVALAAESRKLRRTMNLGLVLVDGIQPSRLDRPRRSDVVSEDGERSSAALKALARELQLPVVVTCPLEGGGADRMPSLTERDEGLERHADMVLFLDRIDHNPGANGLDKLAIQIAKNRRGRTADFVVSLEADPGRTDEGAEAATTRIEIDSPSAVVGPSVGPTLAPFAATAQPTPEGAPPRDDRRSQRLAYYQSALGSFASTVPSPPVEAPGWSPTSG